MNSEQAKNKYREQANRMQHGVALLLTKNRDEVDPRFLRVALNTTFSDLCALAKLLIDKGIITEEEYLVAIATNLEREANEYEQKAQNIFGSDGIRI